MPAPRHLSLVENPAPARAEMRAVSGNWTVAAAAAGAVLGSLVTSSLGMPWPHPMESGPGGDIDLISGMLVGAPLAAAVAATFVRRVMGATFVVPEWLREMRAQPDQAPVLDRDLG